MCFEASDGWGSRRVGCVVYSLFSHGLWGSVFYTSTALQEVAHEGTRHGYETQTEPFVPTDRLLTEPPIPPYLCTMVVGCHGRPTTHQKQVFCCLAPSARNWNARLLVACGCYFFHRKAHERVTRNMKPREVASKWAVSPSCLSRSHPPPTRREWCEISTPQHHSPLSI